MKAFVEDILVGGKLEKLPESFDGDNSIQHNPHVADNVSGLGAALQAMAKQGITMKCDRMYKILGEEDFAWAMSEGQFGGKHVAF